MRVHLFFKGHKMGRKRGRVTRGVTYYKEIFFKALDIVVEVLQAKKTEKQ